MSTFEIDKMFPERQALLSERIGSCQSRAELMDNWSRAAREYGLDYVTLAVAPTAQDKLLGPLVRETTLPADYCRQFDRLEFLKHCPTVTHISRSIMHNAWTIGHEGSTPTFDCPPEFSALMLKYRLITGILFSMNSVEKGATSSGVRGSGWPGVRGVGGSGGRDGWVSQAKRCMMPRASAAGDTVMWCSASNTAVSVATPAADNRSPNATALRTMAASSRWSAFAY